MDGTSYEGLYEKGKKHGFGQLTYRNGEQLKGQFDNDFLEGEGSSI